MNFKEQLKIDLEKQLNIPILIEIPPNDEFGDLAIHSYKLKLPPQELKNKIKLPKYIEKTEIKGPYLNFFINKSILANSIIKDILSKKEKYGRNKSKEKIMVEFPSPNTNKPLHLGHLRNIALGESISRILEFNGNKVIRASINNDRGIHICKSMLAYIKFGKGDSPKKQQKKSDHFVGDYYVLFSKKAKEDPSLESEAQDLLIKWEAGDKKTIEVWKKMNKWALDGFKETYKTLGIKHNKEYFESKVYKKGKEIVEIGLKKGIFTKREDGAVVIDLTQEGLDEKVLLRPDGTSVYITQDLYLAKLKDEEYNLDGSIYVVANEQDYHFKVLFLILKKLNFKFANKLHHLSYGMVELPEGRMKSREGNVVDSDNIINETKSLAKEEIQKRFKDISKKELEDRSLKIAISAIKYKLLRVDIVKNMLFNPNEAISFEGDTGPYLQYSYARAFKILKKTNKNNIKLIEYPLEDQEYKLCKKLAEFPEQVHFSFENLNPTYIANYALSLAQSFNEFYHACPVLNSDKESFRLKLVECFTIVMKQSLNLLGIDVLEEM